MSQTLIFFIIIIIFFSPREAYFWIVEPDDELLAKQGKNHLSGTSGGAFDG
jgi:hypothetical protein